MLLGGAGCIDDLKAYGSRAGQIFDEIDYEVSERLEPNDCVAQACPEGLASARFFTGFLLVTWV